MNLQGIVAFQSTGSIFGFDGIGFPLIFTQFIGFFLFLIAAQAELTQTPFDMPVAESELVAGYMVEYTGFRFLFFFIGEFGTAFAFSAIAATLYLGGWALPASWGIDLGVMRFLGPLVLFAKIMAVAFLMFWVRFTYPRLREDQLQALAWKFLIPIGLLNILLTGVFKVAICQHEEAQAPRRHRRPRHHVQDDDEAGGDGAVPARAGRSSHPSTRRHRAQGGELHGLHAVRALLPRLVHLHRGPQGEASAAP